MNDDENQSTFGNEVDRQPGHGDKDNGHDHGGPGHGGDNPGQNRDEFTVEVLYNGMKKPFEVRRDDQVKSLLDKAVAAFGSPPNPHMLSLFNAAGVELKDDLTIAAAGVKPKDVLLLRPSQVKGG